MIIKMSLSAEEYQELESKAKAEKTTVQNYIRFKVLSKKIPIFDPEEAYNLALAKFNKGEIFTLPDVYGEAGWEKIVKLNPNMAGVYGRLFWDYVEETKTEIECVDKNGRRAKYVIK